MATGCGGLRLHPAVGEGCRRWRRNRSARTLGLGLIWLGHGKPAPAETRRIISWIFAAHQMGGALAGIGAGAVRSFSRDYLLAFSLRSQPRYSSPVRAVLPSLSARRSMVIVM